MGSAFTPVSRRGASPGMTLSNSNNISNRNSAPLKPGRRPSNKRTRRSSSSKDSIPPQTNNNIGGGSLFQMNAVAECDDEDEAATLETMPDHLSTSASEASSKGSNISQPPLLDFIGQTRMASAWFTSCFPCSVVDINDSDTYVVDRLSRQSAMNVMHPNDSSIVTGGGSSIVVEGSVASNSLSGSQRQPPGVQGQGRTIHRNRSDQEKNLVFVRLPEQQQAQQEQAPQPRAIPPVHSMPSMIQEEDDDGDDDALEEVSLDSSSSVKKVRPIYSPHNSNPIYAPPKDPTKSKKFSVKKMFGRKKK